MPAVQGTQDGIAPTKHPSFEHWPFALGAGVVLVLFAVSRDWRLFLLLAMPLIGGLAISLMKPAEARRWSTLADDWLSRHLDHTQRKDTPIGKWIARPLYWAFNALTKFTEQFRDEFVRVGIKAASYACFAFLLAYLLFAYTAVMIVIALVVVGFTIFKLATQKGAGISGGAANSGHAQNEAPDVGPRFIPATADIRESGSAPEKVNGKPPSDPPPESAVPQNESKNFLEEEGVLDFIADFVLGSKTFSHDQLDTCFRADLPRCMTLAMRSGKANELLTALEHEFRGITLARGGNHTEAIQEYRKAVDAFPEGPHFKYRLAIGYFQAELFKEALPLLEEFIQLQPDDREAKYFLSRCCYLNHDVDKAIALMEDCIAANSEPRMNLQLGVFYASKGETLGQELCTELGRYDEQQVAELCCPYFEKALHNFIAYKRGGGELDEKYFNKVCNLHDQLSPGKLQHMGIRLSLNRLHRVLSNLGDVTIPDAVMNAEFVPAAKVCSAWIATSEDRQNGRILYTAYLYETVDTDLIPKKLVNPSTAVEIYFPGLKNSAVPDVNLVHFNDTNLPTTSTSKAPAAVRQTSAPGKTTMSSTQQDAKPYPSTGTSHVVKWRRRNFYPWSIDATHLTMSRVFTSRRGVCYDRRRKDSI
jgi:tetratricopeptide (TPR) repeat protein